MGLAGELIGGAVLGAAVSKLSDVIIEAIKKTVYFKDKLNEMKSTMDELGPIFEEMKELNQDVDGGQQETKSFMSLLDKANVLVPKCQHIKFNLWKRYRHASKLEDLNKSFIKYITTRLPVYNSRDTKKILKIVTEKSSSSVLSCGAPLLRGDVVGFDDQVRELKTLVLKDSPADDCSIVVVSAAGGSGKTTFVTLFCNDPEIKGRFGENIYFVTVSQSYDVKVIIKKLLGELSSDTNNEDAIQQWGRFVSGKESEILLVLDDVWSDSVIKDFKFKLPKYKVLVTSRIIYTEYKTYRLKILNDQNAAHLFCCSAFSKPENEDSNIRKELVDKLIKCCKNHPLLLSVIGGSLNGKPESSWMLMLKKLSKRNRLFSGFHKSIRESLEKSFHLLEEEPEIKQCYQDLGLFPEDQMIAATTLMDIWVHLYNHDEDGSTTMDILSAISSRNLANLLPIRKHLSSIANHCEEEHVMQHDMMRELAIHLSSKEPPEHRERLILNSNGQDLPQSPQILPQFPQTVITRILSVSIGLFDSFSRFFGSWHTYTQIVGARVLSVFIDEKFSLTWDEIQAPNVEVLVLNFMSEIHPLPRIIQTMEKLKVLIITNYGYNFSEIQNFPAPQYLSGLKRIRLDHVSISSVSTTILKLENLQKLSLIMCKIGNSFSEEIHNKLASLLEIDIESCDDLVTFPVTLCDSVQLKNLSITNCHELSSLPEEVGKLSNLEVLQVASCSKLTKLPESVTTLKKLKTIDISQCISIRELPQNIGELGSLQTINATGCTGLHDELPESVHDFDKLVVVCDEETSHLWRHFNNVDVKVVEEDPLDTFFKINPRARGLI